MPSGCTGRANRRSHLLGSVRERRRYRQSAWQLPSRVSFRRLTFEAQRLRPRQERRSNSTKRRAAATPKLLLRPAFPLFETLVDSMLQFFVIGPGVFYVVHGG